MEVDWEFEIASDAPVLDAAWSGFIDLQREPERAPLLEEAVTLPALADVLIRLNAAGSGYSTAKCDVWDPGAIDPDEFDATTETAGCALACYIDLLPAGEQAWTTLDVAADWCRGLCVSLRSLPLRQSRADLLIRRAFASADKTTLGLTVYLAACGTTTDAASAVLGTALHSFVDTICNPSRPPHPA